MTAWKKAEDRLAKLFGTRRRPLSGGNSGGGRDDGLHPVLFLENKHGRTVPLFGLYKDTKKKAKKEGRVPVIGLQKYRSPGILLVIHSDDFPTVVKEWMKANPKETEGIKLSILKDLERKLGI